MMLQERLECCLILLDEWKTFEDMTDNIDCSTHIVKMWQLLAGRSVHDRIVNRKRHWKLVMTDFIVRRVNQFATVCGRDDLGPNIIRLVLDNVECKISRIFR